MKIERKENEFIPIWLILETQEELEILKEITKLNLTIPEKLIKRRNNLKSYTKVYNFLSNLQDGLNI